MNLKELSRNPWMRRAAGALAGLLVVWALAWLALPPIIRSQLEARGSAALGRNLTVGAVDFKPWSLELTLTDLAIATADAKSTQFKVARVYVDAELQSVLRAAPVVDAVTLESPQLSLTHWGQGHYDVDDILARLMPADEPPSSSPARFSLHNLVLQGGSIDFNDHQRNGVRQHTVRNIHLAVPFLSNFDSQREVVVQPRLAFELNGSAFDTELQGTPFAQTRKGELNLHIAALDVAPYLPYLPQTLPVQLKSAVLDTDVHLAFVERPAMSVALRGSVKLSNLAWADAKGQPWFHVQSVALEMQEVLPLERKIQLQSLDIAEPTVLVRRDAAGRINVLAGPGTGGASNAPSSSAAVLPAARPASSADAAQTSQPPKAWQISLQSLNLHRGRLQWSDDQVKPQAQLALVDLEVQAAALQWPLGASPATLEASAGVASQVARAPREVPARIAVKGRATDAVAQAHVQVDALGLGLAGPYLSQWIVPALGGRANVDLDAQWKAGVVTLDVNHAGIQDFSIADAPQAKKSSRDLPTQFKSLDISDVHVDLSKRSAKVGRIALQSPRLTVARDEQGAWMFEQWLAALTPQSGAGTNTPVPTTNAPAAATPDRTASWAVVVGDVALQDGALTLRDRFAARRVNVAVTDLNVTAKSVTLEGAQPAQVKISAHMKSGQTEPGSVLYNGTLGWKPLQAQGALELTDIPAHALVPYMADRLNIEVLRADASAKGSVRLVMTPQGPDLQLHMDAALEDFRANSLSSNATQGLAVGEELLNWKSLNVPGIDLQMAPGKATRLKLREAVLSDFFARVVVNPQGRLNLQELVKPVAQLDAKAEPLALGASAAGAASTVPSSEVAGLDPIITVGPISLVNGRVPFSDRFIQPNYSADLSELTGKLSQFSTQAPGAVVQLADLDLRGRAEGSATLEITGRVNPLARPLALNIQGKVRDLELPPLSPYAIKYAGYGIERGKLNVDVSYVVQPDGQLTASNKIVLHQLSFGDKVEGAPNSLPVKLAVALLADRHGVIDLDLPISGSLNDPQFSVGPVIWKAITNLIAKALTSPFSLLANAFGGSDALSQVAFAPGSAELSTESRKGLDQIAQALRDKSELTMTVLGAAHPQAEHDALQRVRLNALVLAEKRRRAAVTGQDTAAVDAVNAQEYPVLLKEVYKRADIRKPRNMLGLTKDLSTPEMEALLLASIAVTDDGMRELALSRGVAVRDYLAGQKIPAQRLYLGAIKLVSEPDWKPQAELKLSTQ